MNEAGLGQEAEPAGAGVGSLPSDVYASLAHLTQMSDRDHPLVFAGRDQEFELLDAAIYGTQRGGVGRTVVVQGVPGAGKTSLLNEYANRLAAREQAGQPPVIPVPLRPNDLDAPPAAIIEEIDRQYREFVTVDERSAKLDSAVNSTMLAARTLFASFTKRDFSEFRLSARAPASLPIALDEYVSFRVGRKGSTIVLLVDEAQNLEDTQHVRRHLDTLHGGIRGNTHMLLACFGLANTVERLRVLGLSRLANGHVRTIGRPWRPAVGQPSGPTGVGRSAIPARVGKLMVAADAVEQRERHRADASGMSGLSIRWRLFGRHHLGAHRQAPQQHH